MICTRILRLSVLPLLLTGTTGFAQQQEISVSNIRIHRVQRERPYQVRDEQGKQKRYQTAYLVQMDLEGLPRNLNTRIDFLIGDYRIREYGGTSAGIYFKLYETDRLRKLQGAEIRYSVGGQEPRPLGARFAVPAELERLPILDERKALRADVGRPEVSLKAGNVRVERVRPAGRAYVVRNARNEKKTYQTAYLVRVDIRGLPRDLDTQIDFFAGDHRITEYGGTTTGIYFRVYETAELKRLAGADLQYAIGKQPRRSLGAKLNFSEGIDTREVQDESKVLGRD